MIQRILAVFLAAALSGGSVAYAFQGTPADDAIFDQVRRKLANDPDVRGAAFEVTVKDGVVTIRGAVEKDKYKKKAERLVKKVKGVKQVKNELRVAPR
jgi:osmotically-inducible protein OsmY